jgi:acyl-coenzyme A thioesterase PaaI-like protein
MAVDTQAVASGMLEAVPFARTLGVEFLAVTEQSAELRLADSPSLHNHVGGPHAGVAFSLGETASGAVVLAAFGAELGRVVPLALRAEISYRKLAMGPLRAMARMDRAPAEVLAELDSGARPEIPVRVEISTEDGVVTAEMTIFWILRLRP